METINKIIVLKDGFLIFMPDDDSGESNILKKYILVFNKSEYHDFVHFIAEYTKGKKKDDTKKCPSVYLIDKHYKKKERYKNSLRKCIEDPKRDNRPFGSTTLFSIYHLYRDNPPNPIQSPKTRKSFYFDVFIKMERKEKNSSKKENLRFWLGDYKTTTIEFETEKSVSEYGINSPKDKNKLAPEKPSYNNDLISDEKNKLYPWFIKRTENLTLENLKDIAGFGITEADENPDYIERKDVKINGKLTQYVKEGKDVLITGPMGVGKTRYAFEELKSLNGYYVFSFPDFAMNQALSKDISEKFVQLKGKRLIWFIDDMHRLSKEERLLGTMYEKLIKSFGKVVVIATIRSDIDKYEQSRVRKNMHSIKIDTWSDSNMEKLANHYGKDTDNLPGVPLYLFKDVDNLEELFKKYQKKEKDCVWLMRYLKLLNEFLEHIDYKFLRETYLHLRDKEQGVDEFENAFITLKQAGFIERKEKYVKTWDLILEKIVVKDDYSDFDQHMVDLIPFFLKRKRYYELTHLGLYFYQQNNFNKSVDCWRQLIEDNKKDENTTVAMIYFFWGSALRVQAQSTNNVEKSEEACLKYEKAIEINPKYAEAYYEWGIALLCLEKSEEACLKYEKAIEINPKYAWAYCYWGTALEISTNGKADVKTILELYTKAFLLFILKKEWEVARKIVVPTMSKKFEKSEHNFLLETICILLIGLDFILIPNKKNDIINFLIHNKKIKKMREDTLWPYPVIVDAILENKKPDLKVDLNSDDLILNAAIVLANEIVSKSSSST